MDKIANALGLPAGVSATTISFACYSFGCLANCAAGSACCPSEWPMAGGVGELSARRAAFHSRQSDRVGLRSDKPSKGDILVGVGVRSFL
jgi:hypothetical protein